MTSPITVQRARITAARQRPLRAAALILGLTTLAVVMTWPLAPNAGRAVQDLGDPLYEIWTMRGAQHQLATNPSRLWDGNVGFPFPRSLLFSEPRLSTSVLAWPIQILTGNDVLAYNLMLMASYAVLGIGVALLLTEITGSGGAGVVAGALAAFAPYRFGHLSHLNLLSYGWLPLALWALIRFARRRSPWDVLLAALFLTIQLLASDTVALLALGTVALLLPIIVWGERRRRTAGLALGLTISVVLPLLALYPVIQAHQEVNALYGFTRDLGTIRQMSAKPSSYVSVAPGNAFWSRWLPLAYPNPLFPGALTIVGALLGLTLGVRRWPRYVAFAALLAAGSVILSFGPELSLAGHRYAMPYRLLYDHVEIMRSMRDVARFGLTALLGLELLAGLGFAAAWHALRPRLPVDTARWLGPLLAALLLLGTAVEFKNQVGIAVVPQPPEQTAIYDWLARQPDGPVIELPANGLWANIGWTTRQIYDSTRHWQPIVAAYTSFLPQRYVDFLIALHGGTTRASLVTADNVGLLQDIGIRYVVIHQQPGYDWQAAIDIANRLPELRSVGDIGDARAYVLDPGQRLPVRYRLGAPGRAQAGQPVVGSLAVINDNPNLALTTLDRPPSPVAVWLDEGGQEISRTTIPLTLPVRATPGMATWSLQLVAPTTAGRYRLRLSLEGLAPDLEQAVAVEPSAVDSARGALKLQQVSLPDGPLIPGTSIDLQIELAVRSALDRTYTVTAQLLDSSNRPLSQADRLPFGDGFDTTKWQPGTALVVPMRLKVPMTVGTSSARLLIALYDEGSRSLTRLKIELPDGRVAPEYVGQELPFAPH
jgi:hypothetical protein